MTPLPASEVRRRGTRMRRRNQALSAVGALAVVALIATPLAVLAGHRGSSEPQPAPPAPAVSWRQEIPADLDLTAGLPAGTRQRPTFSFDVSGICGSPAWAFDQSDAPVDGAGAGHADASSEGTIDRALVVYADEAAATDSLTRLRAAVRSCPTDPNGPGLPLANTVVGSGTDDSSLVFTQQAKDGQLLSDLTVYQAVRSGNALYLASSHTSAGGDQVAASETRRLQDASAPVVADLCVFAADGC